MEFLLNLLKCFILPFVFEGVLVVEWNPKVVREGVGQGNLFFSRLLDFREPLGHHFGDDDLPVHIDRVIDRRS